MEVDGEAEQGRGESRLSSGALGGVLHLHSSSPPAMSPSQHFPAEQQ
jgi:hypothetical protein